MENKILSLYSFVEMRKPVKRKNRKRKHKKQKKTEAPKNVVERNPTEGNLKLVIIGNGKHVALRLPAQTKTEKVYEVVSEELEHPKLVQLEYK